MKTETEYTITCSYNVNISIILASIFPPHNYISLYRLYSRRL